MKMVIIFRWGKKKMQNKNALRNVRFIIKTVVLP